MQKILKVIINMSAVYIESLHKALPRLLSSFNVDTTSDLAGVGDRLHWGWKLIDFPNGTFQGAVHGLAILLRLKELPENLDESELLFLIRLIVSGLRNITAKNGSLDEALPNESSFCVTALVVSDVLAARELLFDYLSDEELDEWLEIVKPLIEFLLIQDEFHGVISNHLASGALAMYRWKEVSGDNRAEQRGRMWLDRILKHQSSEGWFSEYGSADPGYQTWCTTQLAQLHLLRPDLGLSGPLSHSLSFLTHAAHPDGSFGGIYGNRNTRFLLPGGIELLAEHDSNAALLAYFARDSIGKNACVTLDCMDAGNLVPFFNDYALAAWAESQQGELINDAVLPCQGKSGRKWFPDSGWLIDIGEQHFSIINLKRGGTCVHFSQGKRVIDDPGFVAEDEKGRIYSSQLGCVRNLADLQWEDKQLTVQFPVLRVDRPVPGALDFFILRMLSLTLFRILPLGNLVKRFLAKYLINKHPREITFVTRKYQFGKNLKIEDETSESVVLRKLSSKRHFTAIHMASQGYWQRGDYL